MTKTCEKEETSQTYFSRHEISVKGIETRHIDSQKLHVKACKETASLKRELDDIRAQLKMQQRKLEFEERKNKLEEHKMALMLLRGRRTVDGGCMLGTRKETNNDHQRSSELRQATYSGDLSTQVTSTETKRLPGYSPLWVEKPCLEFERAEKEVRSVSSPVRERPVMVSVGTSTDDLDELVIETDVDFKHLKHEHEREMEENDWNIRENMLCREEGEGRSRSVSPDTEEKKSFADGQIVYLSSLDEEVRQRQSV